MSEKTNSKDHLEMMVAILMSIVVIATAWSAYQSTLWGGVQTFALRDASASGVMITTNILQQNQYSTVDGMMFFEYVNALHNNNTQLSNFYFERFRPDFKPAVEAWLETNPFENPNAPPHPFVMDEYKKTFSEEAEKLAVQQGIKLKEAEQANRNSDNYVLMTVLYAGILFIGGILSRFSKKQVQTKLLITGWALFSVVTFFLLTMPVAPLFE